MRRLAIAAALAVTASAAVANGEPAEPDGRWLLLECEAPSLRCVDVLTSVVQTQSFIVDKWRWCLPPEGVTYGQLAQHAVNDLRANPEFWRLHAAAAVIVVLKRLYPCPAPKQ